MPYANNNGVNIYYEVEGAGTPVLLAHGMSMSLEDWKEWGYVSTLSENHKVILVDGRGHGKSDKPHEPKDYLQHMRAADHVAVLDQLGVEIVHLVGYSMGASTCFGIALNHPKRCQSLILGGFQPFSPRDLSHLKVEKKPEPFEGLPASTDPIFDLLRSDPDAWIHFWDCNIYVSPEMKKRLASNDYKALIAYWHSPDDWRVGVANKLMGLSIPSLFYAGEKETVLLGAQEAVRLMPHGRFISFQNMNHFDIFIETELVTGMIEQFVSEVETRLVETRAS